MFFARSSAAILIVLLVSTLAHAQTGRSRPQGPSPEGGLFSGTPEERAACNHDSVKFCRDDIPDTFAVLSCLQDHRKKLRKACRRVLESHGK